MPSMNESNGISTSNAHLYPPKKIPYYKSTSIDGSLHTIPPTRNGEKGNPRKLLKYLKMTIWVVIMNQPTIHNMLINPNHEYYVTIFKQAPNRISEAMLEKP